MTRSGPERAGGDTFSSNLPRTAVTALAPLAWGTTYVVTTELLPPGHPLFAGLLRALPAGLVALAFTRTLPNGAWWGKAATLGVLNIGLFFPLLFVAAERLPGGVAATLGAVQPLVVAVLAATLLREGLSVWRAVWGVTGVLGVGLVVIGPDAMFDAVGIVAGLLGAAAMALGVTLTKRWQRPAGVSPMAFAGWQLSAGGLFLVPVTFLVEGPPPAIDPPAVLGYLWLGLIGGLCAYVLWFRGVIALPVTSVAVLGLLSPLVAALLGAVLLDQTLGPIELLGFGLALAAIAAGQLPVPTRPRHPYRKGQPECRRISPSPSSTNWRARAGTNTSPWDELPVRTRTGRHGDHRHPSLRSDIDTSPSVDVCRREVLDAGSPAPPPHGAGLRNTPPRRRESG